MSPSVTKEIEMSANRKFRSRYKTLKRRCQPDGEYGRLGLTLHPTWATYVAFKRDMGLPPSDEHTLDRIDNLKGYEPGNVRWATRKEQLTNRQHNPARFVVIDGIDDSVRAHCKRLGVSYSTVKKRIMRGWDAKDAILTPKGEKP